MSVHVQLVYDRWVRMTLTETFDFEMVASPRDDAHREVRVFGRF